MTRVEPNSFTVSAVYDFSAADSGTFTFDPVPRFQVVGLNDAVEANTTHSISITVSDDVSKRELDLEKRSTVQCDINADKDRYGRMLSAAGNVYSLAATAGWYISVKGTGDPIYRRYFGKLPKDLVLANFKAIKDMDRWVTLDCSCPSHNCKPGRCLQKDPVYSTVTLVYFCDPFFTPSYHPVNAFCTNPTDVDYNRVGVTFRVYATLLPSTRIVESSCDQAANSIDSDKLKNTYSYAVSIQTPHDVPGAHVLTWVITFVVLRCRGLQIGQVLMRIITIYIYWSLPKSTFERHWR